MDLATWPFDGSRPRASGRVGTIFDGGGEPFEFSREEQFHTLVDAILDFVAFESWCDNGGDIGLVYYFDDRTLIVRQTQAAHLEIRRLLHAIEHPEPIARATPAGPGDTSLRVYDVRPIFEAHPVGQRYIDLRMELRRDIERTIGMRHNGGWHSRCMTVGTRLLVRTTPENHEAIQALLRDRLKATPTKGE
jgi:hypothetical protein